MAAGKLSGGSLNWSRRASSMHPSDQRRVASETRRNFELFREIHSCLKGGFPPTNRDRRCPPAVTHHP